MPNHKRLTLTMRRLLATLAVVPSILTVLATSLHAEETPPSAPSHRNAVSFSVGIATASDGGERVRNLGRLVDFGGGRSSSGGLLGGTLLRDLNDRVSVEFLAGYLDRGVTHGVTGMGQFLVNLTDPGKVVPYVSAGGGAYQTTRERDFSVEPSLTVPAVDRNRRRVPVSIDVTPTAATIARRSTDPALSLGGGVRLDLGPRFFARPDARLMMIMTDGRNELFGLFTFNVGLRF